ncbi:unnamed protein product [Polarella glacialis]|uniref:Uncharacterized protein n=1 Tax=Polarella glacialis TaxID=89957 RepID=A0A813K2A5_POLGL|nr:unnamed protein product [Polarella glacialis]
MHFNIYAFARNFRFHLVLRSKYQAACLAMVLTGIAVWHACEATVARRGAEMASAAAEGKEDGLVFSELVSRACREAGKCEKSQKRKPRKAKMSQKKREKADL